jgi:hypothetical protein
LAESAAGLPGNNHVIRPQRLFTVEQSAILYAAGKIRNARSQEVKGPSDSSLHDTQHRPAEEIRAEG